MRKKINPQPEADVLLQSRRRCCICFGLHRNTSIKQGQIAHIDRDSSNNEINNLAFLCLNHHDSYDSKTSQSKGFTPVEVKRYRDELYAAIQITFSIPVTFAEVKEGVSYQITGHYISRDFNNSAEIIVQLLENKKYHVTGTSFWGTTHKYGPNIGTLDFVADLNEDTIEYQEQNGDKIYRLSLKFQGDSISVSEENWVGMFGMNVNFSSDYKRANSLDVPNQYDSND
jgi:hypothetical protein